MVLWLIGFCWFVNKIRLTEPEINKKFDAIVVLTGAKGRIETGIKLLSAKKAGRLFISGVGKNAVLKDLVQHFELFTPEQMELLKHSITLGHEANSTEENAIETSRWLNQNDYKDIILVTSNYHMPRSLYLFNSLIPNISITPYPLVKNSISLKLALLEYNKYLLYFFHIETLQNSAVY